MGSGTRRRSSSIARLRAMVMIQVRMLARAGRSRAPAAKPRGTPAGGRPRRCRGRRAMLTGSRAPSARTRRRRPRAPRGRACAGPLREDRRELTGARSGGPDPGGWRRRRSSQGVRARTVPTVAQPIARRPSDKPRMGKRTRRYEVRRTSMLALAAIAAALLVARPGGERKGQARRWVDDVEARQAARRRRSRRNGVSSRRSSPAKAQGGGVAFPITGGVDRSRVGRGADRPLGRPGASGPAARGSR